MKLLGIHTVKSEDLGQFLKDQQFEEELSNTLKKYIGCKIDHEVIELIKFDVESIICNYYNDYKVEITKTEDGFSVEW